ncbi:MAG: hypothetical protein ACK5N8_03475 [Alphaproteobacteria bacterium]
MNSKFKYVLFLVLSFAFLPKAHAVVNFNEYIPTIDKKELEGSSSAYVLVYEKTDEAHADFSTYEKDANGKFQKIYYKYTTNIKSGVSSSVRQDVASGTVLVDLSNHYLNQNITQSSVDAVG